MKYIIFEEAGLEFPILFPDFIEHNRVALKFLSSTPISAGWVRLRNDGIFVCNGKSESLGLEARAAIDPILINEHFTKSV